MRVKMHITALFPSESFTAVYRQQLNANLSMSMDGDVFKPHLLHRRHNRTFGALLLQRRPSFLHMVWITYLCVFGFPWELWWAWAVHWFCVVLKSVPIPPSTTSTTSTLCLRPLSQQPSLSDRAVVCHHVLTLISVVFLSFSRPSITSPSTALVPPSPLFPFYPRRADRFQIFILTDYQRGCNIETR